jgi:hypothetical protein
MVARTVAQRIGARQPHHGVHSQPRGVRANMTGMTALWSLVMVLGVPADVFGAYLDIPCAAVETFVAPVEKPRAWRVTTAGAQETWRRQSSNEEPVRAMANGRVLKVDVDGVTTLHVLFENERQRRIHVVTQGLVSTRVSPGDNVVAGQVLGLAQRTWKMRAQADGQPVAPRALAAAHPHIFVPSREPVLVLVDQATYRLRVYRQGVMELEVGVAFGQAQGVKERVKDLKTPRGMYFVTDKSTGPFGGDYADYYGGHWIKVNYPNAYDARRGLADGLITAAQAALIEEQHWTRSLTPQGTRLGGGIGLHGWAATWDAGPGEAHLSWGCVVLQPTEVAALYRLVEAGTMVVIF